MEKKSILEKSTHYLQWLACLFLIISLIGSYRAISSISVGILLVTGFISNRPGVDRLFKMRYNSLFLVGLLALFIIDLISFAYTGDKQQGWNSLRIKTGLVLVPLSIWPQLFSETFSRKWLLQFFIIALALASFFCIVYAVSQFRISGELSVFFYHQLVSPLHQHAVYFSILVFIGLVYLTEAALSHSFLYNRVFHLFLLTFLSCFLCLLSSRLVIVVYGIYLAYSFLNSYKKNTFPRTKMVTGVVSLLLVATALMAVKNPINQRFYEITRGNLNLLSKDHFDKGDYFNGLQFRLLQWRLVTDVLDQERAWLYGVGIGDAQTHLEQEYFRKNIYTGDPKTGSKGYLIYNTHNQFLQTLLQTGIAGIAALIIVCIAMIGMTAKRRQSGYTFIIALLLSWLFTESVFETQYGVLIFTFFPLFLQKTNPS